MNRSPIYPMHPSMAGSQFWRRVPSGLTSVKMEPTAKERLTTIAIDVFTVCVNGGKTFQDALLAIYMTGIENGSEAAQSLERGLSLDEIARIRARMDYVEAHADEGVTGSPANLQELVGIVRSLLPKDAQS